MPYLYWTFDAPETVGTQALSLPTGSGNPATYLGGVPIAPGQHVEPVAGSLPGKTALSFDGTSPLGTLLLGAPLALGTGDFTLFGHVYSPPGTGFGFDFASWESPAGGHVLTLGHGPGGVNFAVGTSFADEVGGNVGTAACPEGAYFDSGVVVRRGAGTATGWLNGVAGTAPLNISSLAGLSFSFPNIVAAWPRFAARVGSPTAPYADLYRPQRLAERYIARVALTDEEMVALHELRLDGISIKDDLNL